jgi:DNA-binding beta-propeller fold protein YncE
MTTSRGTGTPASSRIAAGPLEAGRRQYELVSDWAQLPDGWVLGQTAIATDSADRVYLFNRSDHPLIVLDRDGNYLNSWGEGLLTSAHGIFLDEEESLYLPVFGSHVIYKFSSAGDLLLELGSRDNPSDTGWARDWRLRPERSAGPFNTPADIAVTKQGAIYVADGYGNARIHRFSPQGELEISWGDPGDGPGQFHVAHGIWVHDDGRVFVADRENNRIQVFTGDGAYLEEWGGFARPCDIYVDEEGVVFVAELSAFVTLLTLDGEVIARWPNAITTSEISGAHALWLDSHGDLYLNVSQDGRRIEKYRRVR